VSVCIGHKQYYVETDELLIAYSLPPPLKLILNMHSKEILVSSKIGELLCQTLPKAWILKILPWHVSCRKCSKQSTDDNCDEQFSARVTWQPWRCSIRYLAVPNNFTSAPLHVRDLAKSCAPVFVYLIFISSVTVMVMIKVRVRVLGLGLVVGLGLIIPTCCANLVLRVICQCNIFGMPPALCGSVCDS